MKAYKLETPEIKVSNITPFENGNKIKINGSLAVGDKDTKYGIYLNGKLLTQQAITDKLDKKGDTMTGTLVMGKNDEDVYGNIDARESDVFVKNLIVNNSLVVQDINLLNLVNTKANNEDYITFKTSTSTEISNLKNSILNKVDKDVFKTSLDSKADKSNTDFKINAIESDTKNIKNNIDNIEYSVYKVNENIGVLNEKIKNTIDPSDYNLLKQQVHENSSRINSINTTIANHVDKKNHLHLTKTDIEAINDIPNKASKACVHLINTDISEIKCNIEEIWKEIDQGKHGITRLTVNHHDDTIDLSYIDKNVIYSDVNINKAVEISDEETKVPPTNLIKHYVDDREKYIISLINEHSFKVVRGNSEGHPDVPEEERKTTIIYLVKENGSQESDNYYIEWLWVEKEDVLQWEKIGSTKINLDEYAKKEYVNESISDHEKNKDIHITTKIEDSSSVVALECNKIFEVSDTSIEIIPASVINKLIKSTILFKPTEDVNVYSLFVNDDDIDEIIYYENILRANKLSVIEITQVNTQRNKLCDC